MATILRNRNDKTDISYPIIDLDYDSQTKTEHYALIPLDNDKNRNTNTENKLIDLDLTGIKLNEQKQISISNKEQNIRMIVNNVSEVIIRKKFMEMLENEDLLGIDRLMFEYPNSSIFSAFFHQRNSKNQNCIDLALALSTKTFIGSIFIKNMFKHGLIINDHKIFLTQLKNLVETTYLSFSEWTLKYVEYMTFNEFIEICKLLITNDTNLESQHKKAVYIIQMLQTTYFSKFNQSGYDFLEYLFLNHIITGNK